MYIPGTAHLTTSDTYPNPQDRCLDGMMINAEGQDVLRCRVHILGGTTTDCEGEGFKYSPLSKLQANYECQGSTRKNSCNFRGLSQIGEMSSAHVTELEVTKNHTFVAYV